MTKKITKSAFFCRNCGFESAKWLGKCPSCGEWNTFIEENISPTASRQLNPAGTPSSPLRMSEITSEKAIRMDTQSEELNRVLGGGLVSGSLVLLGGEPGIGKSTLALQVAMQMTALKTLYVSGEESLSQIKLRAGRIGEVKDHCLFYNETSLTRILEECDKIEPELLIIDSIQTLFWSELEASAGTISQVRECAARLLKYAKTTQTPVILIGHITKDGLLAGPKILEHIVDTVLQFEGDHRHVYRILRVLKNRFGSSSELGIFEMHSKGLREVTNPSEMLITNHDTELSGIAIGATMEGIRPLLIEVQSLVSTAAYGTPQRSCTGFDVRRLNMLLAVLEKRAGFRLSQKDVFLNMAGGLRVEDPAIDLAVVAAILSSNIDQPLSNRWSFAGEVGLSGQIRPVARIEQRIREAEKTGFKKIFVATAHKKNLAGQEFNIEIAYAEKIDELIRKIFSQGHSNS